MLCIITCLGVCALNGKCQICVRTYVCRDVDVANEWAAKINFIVQGVHPEYILEKDGTFLKLEEGRARLQHTHTHTVTPTAWVKACEPEIGACLARARRQIQKFQRDLT